MNRRLIAMGLCCLLWVVTPVGAVRANDAPPVGVTGSIEGRTTMHIDAKRPGVPGHASSGRVAAPDEPPRERVTVRPTCTVNNNDPNAARYISNCVPDKCVNGKDQYIQITDDLQKGRSSLDILCGIRKNDPGVLAVSEFYRASPRVSVPLTAPATTTLANFPNIFWSDVAPYEQPTSITVANVRLRLVPARYVWDFGDSETMITTDAGKPYDPQLVKTTQDALKNYTHLHRYTHLGTFDLKLTIVFNGQYSINGGAWTDITGSVQATSPTHPLTVKQARGQLINGDKN